MNQDVKGIREIRQADCRETRKLRYLASNNMLVELDSRQEMKMTTDAPGKVFPELYIFANIFHCTEMKSKLVNANQFSYSC